ncbi:PIN domain-containing protein [[Kitasatospora] papulosa]|uniref:PIN domain-containing protein n=1 Tax=Streptomyces TaxID=1883 RepID=UPI002FEEC55C
MIILDTCVIRSMSLDSSEADVLRAIARTKTERVGAPWMVIEELAAQKALEYLEAHSVAAGALRQLHKKSYQTEPSLTDPNPEAVREKWRKRYSRVVEVLSTSDNAIRQGLYREANVLPPAGTKGGGNNTVKVGARDVAIWLTAVEYAREHPDENVYFVSSNHRDFTKGGSGYPPPMDADVADLGDRFAHLTSLTELLETFAPPLEVDTADARGALEMHTGYVSQRARKIWETSNTLAPFNVRTQDGEARSATMWLRPDSIEADLLDVRDIKAYRLGTNSWFVATARWQFAGLAAGPSWVDLAACVWETRILFPTRSGDEHAPSIIDAARAVPVEDASTVDWTRMLNWSLARDAFKRIELEGREPTVIEALMSALMAFQPVGQTGLPQAYDLLSRQIHQRHGLGQQEDRAASDEN